MAKIACENGKKERIYKASDIYNAQTQKISSTTLERDYKYAFLQKMRSPNSVCRYTIHSMQNKGQKRFIKRGIISNDQTT